MRAYLNTPAARRQSRQWSSKSFLNPEFAVGPTAADARHAAKKARRFLRLRGIVHRGRRPLGISAPART